MENDKFESSKYYNDLLEAISQNGGGNWDNINMFFHCYVDESIEKHHELQYTHYFTITSDLIGGEMNIEMENGINNGTVINSISYSGSLKPSSKTIEVIKDVILDEERVVKEGFSLEKARLLFPSYKNKILKLNKESDYDSYVTGGGTNKINNHYNNKFNEIRDLGIFWTYEYEEIEVDINFTK